MIGDERVGLRRVVWPDDETFLFRVYCSTREDILAAGLEPKQERMLMTMQQAAQNASYRQNFPNAEEHLVTFDGEPVGRYVFERRNGEVRGVDLAILPEFRGLGIGGAVIERVIQECSDSRSVFVFHALKTNPAGRLYERLGCVVTSENETHYRFVHPGTGETKQDGGEIV